MVELGELSGFFASSFCCTNICQSAGLLLVVLETGSEGPVLKESPPLQFSSSLTDSKEMVLVQCQTVPLLNTC